MKFLFLKSPLIRTSFVPLGLGYLGSVLENAGHKVEIMDMAVSNLSMSGFSDFLSQRNPDVVGITCMNTEFKHVIKMSKICKTQNIPPIVMIGGPFASAMPNIFLEELTIDYVVIGEGENPIVQFAKNIESNLTVKGIKGLAYRKGEEIICNSVNVTNDLDSIPFPARHLMDMEQYLDNAEGGYSFENWFGEEIKRVSNILSSRGCPYSCIYCDKHVFGQKWRARSATNMIKEIESLMDNYHVQGIIFSDDMFDASKKRVNEFCDEIIMRKLDFSWGINSRPNHANEDIFRKMKKAGCKYVAFGIESGDQKILDIMNRNLTLLQTKNAVKLAKKVGLRTMGYFMTGMIGETKESVLKTINFAKILNLDVTSFSITVPYPGTKLFDIAEKEGLIKNSNWEEWDRSRVTVNLATEINRKDLQRLTAQGNWDLFWSSPSRNTPKYFSNMMSNLSPIVGRVLGDKYSNVISRFDEIRRKMKIALP